MGRAAGLLLLAAAAWPAAASEQEAWFRGLGDLPGGEHASLALAISGDGSTVAGLGRSARGDEGFVWRDGVLSPLGGPAGTTHTVAHAVSRDGSVVAGSGTVAGATRALLWREGRAEILPVPEGTTFSDAWALSADGSAIAGEVRIGGEARAVVWRHGEVSPLADPGGLPLATARALSADGSVVAGTAGPAPGGAGEARAFLWTAGTARALVSPEGRAEGVTVHALSADGGVAVGVGGTVWGTEALRWRLAQGGEALGLGGLTDEHEFFSAARAVSADGAVVAGASEGPAGGEAFVWDEVRGLRPLRAVLAGMGLDVAGWTLEAATAVAGDGRTIAGLGRNPEGQREGWAARLPVGGGGAKAAAGGPSFTVHRATLAGLAEPGGVTIDGEGRVRISLDGGDGGAVAVFDAAGRELGREAARRPPKAWGETFDGRGRRWVADPGHHRVVALGPDGERVASIGRRGRLPGFLLRPAGVVWHAGELHVVDSGNHRIQVWSEGGEWRRSYGLPARRPHEGGGRLHGPESLAIAPDGTWAVVCEPIEDRCQILAAGAPPEPGAAGAAPRDDFGEAMAVAGRLLAVSRPSAGTVDLFDLDAPGEPRRVATAGEPFEPGLSPVSRLSLPAGIALDLPGGRLLVADAETGLVQEWRLGGPDRESGAPAELGGQDEVALSLLRAADVAQLAKALQPVATLLPTRLSSLAAAAAGAAYAIDRANRRILRLDEHLAPRSVLHRPAGPFDPVDLALDPAGRLLVLDAAGHRAVLFDLDGTALGEIPLPPGTDPRGLAAGEDGTLWLIDGASRVFHLAAGGRTLAAFGRPGFGAGEFHHPRRIALDGHGRPAVLDHGNHRIQLFTPTGEPQGAFGSGLFPRPAQIVRSTPGVPATPTPLSLPSSSTTTRRRPPPAPAATSPFAGLSTAGGTFSLLLSPNPAAFPLHEPFDLRVRLLDATGHPPAAGEVELAVDATMPAHRHGMTVRPEIAAGPDGAFAVRGLLLHMPGTWRLTLDVTRAGLTERAQVWATLE